MQNYYNKNGFIFWSQEEIELRKMFEQYFSINILNILRQQNSAFTMIQIEAPLLTPFELINKNYTEEDLYTFNDLVLRPETTMGSYVVAKQFLSPYNEVKFKLPLIIWQHGKSFRKEQDQPTKFMRLKEFYQLEFQIIYGLNTQNDYTIKLFPEMQKMVSNIIGECRLEQSDRLPDYSEETVDIICNNSNMEICSMSKRKDFEGYKVLEIAIGTDRCIYNFKNKK